MDLQNNYWEWEEKTDLYYLYPSDSGINRIPGL
jgi:hypothetical protein